MIEEEEETVEIDIMMIMKTEEEITMNHITVITILINSMIILILIIKLIIIFVRNLLLNILDSQEGVVGML